MIVVRVKVLLILVFVNLVYKIPMTDKELATSASSSQDASPLNWSVCILCQEETNEVLQSPENTRRDDIDSGTGYHSLGDNIISFHEMGFLYGHFVCAW